ncbi:MAG: hypothetical protein WCE64_13575 [Bacteroidales bacterium]
MYKKYFAAIVILILLIISYLVLLTESPDTALRLSREDGIVENLSAIFFFLASCIMFYIFVVTKTDAKDFLFKSRRNYFILLLGLFFFFCAGEEISWGQRIIGIDTPEYMEENNAQKELNIHNLFIFQATDRNNNIKTGLKELLTGHKIFAFIWITFCLLIPVLYRVSSHSNKFLDRISFPVIPLWLGILFLINHLLSKVFESMHLFPRLTPIIETKETDFALLFLFASIVLYLQYRNNTSLTVRANT